MISSSSSVASGCQAPLKGSNCRSTRLVIKTRASNQVVACFQSIQKGIKINPITCHLCHLLLLGLQLNPVLTIPLTPLWQWYTPRRVPLCRGWVVYAFLSWLPKQLPYIIESFTAQHPSWRMPMMGKRGGIHGHLNSLSQRQRRMTIFRWLSIHENHHLLLWSKVSSCIQCSSCMTSGMLLEPKMGL